MVISLLKLLSIFFFLISLFTPHALSYDSSESFSVIGVSAPLFARSIPAVQPGRSLFQIVKAFASESYSVRRSCTDFNVGFIDNEHIHAEGQHWSRHPRRKERIAACALPRHCRGVGARNRCPFCGDCSSNNKCSIKVLVVAFSFHQFFEGMGLGGSILQAEYTLIKKIVMVFSFSVATPFGIALGIALSKTYKENSPVALITVGLLNASSAGLLIYMALVDLLAADFMGPKLQGNIKLQIKCYIAAFLGACGMSLMAKWA
ncbi:hypothetical protein SLA2020_327210 [Shorea laevis]